MEEHQTFLLWKYCDVSQWGGKIPDFFHQNSYAHLLTWVRGRSALGCLSTSHYMTCILGDILAPVSLAAGRELVGTLLLRLLNIESSLVLQW